MEINKKNFADELGNIVKDLNKCSFVGFDAEFTALLSGDLFKYRLFDTNEERYDRLKTEVSKMMMTQIGLTMFEYDRECDSYVAIGYTFHLRPQVVGDIEQSFIFQASTLKFLCRHKFDFNKFIYEGLPYLSKLEESKVRQQINDKTLFKNLTSSIEIAEEKQIQEHCSRVSKWLSQENDGTIYLDVESPIMRYLVHTEIRLRFPNVLTTDSLGNSKKVLVYRNKHIEGAKHTPMSVLEENLVNDLLGFSRIIYLLEASQKPIIGHNIFFDTVLLHNQFIGPMPKKYAQFKKNIHTMFPNIYDTKYISSEMSKKLTYDEVWKSNALQDLYEFFSEGKCRKLQNGVNYIRVKRPFNVDQTYHEAGWDSYCSGYCFIRLGHWMACENRGKYKPVGPTETLAALAPYANKVNVIRGAVPFMNIVENDPPGHRPQLLHVKALVESKIDVGQMASYLASFGSIDVKQYGTRTALIAVGSHAVFNRLLNRFKNSKEYKISTFNKYKHTTAGRMAIWSGALLSGSLVLYFINKNFKCYYRTI